MNCKIYLEIISIIWYNICSQGRNCPLSLVNIFAKANTSQEAPFSTSGSSSLIMGLVVFYNLFKIIFNIIRIIFLKKKVKRFLKIDLISEIIYFLGWINLMRNAIILVPSQIFHSVFYYVAILIFLINKRNKKIHNYILFSIITIDIIIVLFLLNMLKLYLITVITIIVYIFIIVILRKDRDKSRDCGYLTLSLLDIANIFISYIAFIGYAVSAF